jgi:hypothetical protein
MTQGRPRFDHRPMVRCAGMTERTTYQDAHRCPYAAEDGRETEDPALCSRCRDKSRRRALTLVDGRVFRDGVGVTPDDTA